jgi:hypothetical protein
MRAILACLVAVSALLVLPSASAKDFPPGGLLVCNATRCAPIVKRGVLTQLAAFYYHRPVASSVRRPRLGAPFYELRFANGYVTGIVATRRLDRFLSYGVNIGHFKRDRWYTVPPKAAANLRRLTTSLRPLRVTREALEKSR